MHTDNSFCAFSLAFMYLQITELENEFIDNPNCRQNAEALENAFSIQI